MVKLANGYFVFVRMKEGKIVDYETFKDIYNLAISANNEATQSHEAARIFMEKLNVEYIVENKLNIDILISMFIHGFVVEVAERETNKLTKTTFDDIQKALVEINKELVKSEGFENNT